MLRGRTNIGIVVLCLLLVLGGGLACGGRGGKKLSSMPPELVGTWETNAKKYAGCRLEISPKSLSFQGLEDAKNDYFLTEVEKVDAESEEAGWTDDPGPKLPAGTLYFVRCRDTASEEWEFHLTYTSGARETLKFRNRSETWHKKG